ncbi:MAG TPA: hypothetical protein DCZ03_14320 [Gammaproteobacteria bacterium]|nr:hypothetical protein [Gammaproteobacteria bacterium]
MLSDKQLQRYSRHILLPNVDVAGQQKLLQSHVLIVGLGGLGSPAAIYLAASGIGKMTLCDFDRVDESNLQRQVLYHDAQVGQSKTDAAKRHLLQLNPDLQVDLDADVQNLETLRDHCKQVDAIIDASDNFQTRHAVNQACFASRKPLISAAAIRMEGQVAVFDFRQSGSPCYACLYSQNSTDPTQETCTENGILAPVVGILGAMQALETIKVLLNIGETLNGKLLLFDAFMQDWRQVRLHPDPACEVCSLK